MMLPPNFKTTWVLSDSTKAKWTNGGTLILERRKKDILGRESTCAYKVFIKPLTYLSIYEKNKTIQKKMDELIEEENSNPLNFSLHDNHILQLSLFRRDKVLEPYYGIHVLDSEDQIQVGTGVNLTETEWNAFIQMVGEWYGGFESDSKALKEEKEKKRRGKKRKITLESETNDGKKEKKMENDEEKKRLCITLYGWEWEHPSENGKNETQGDFFVNPSACLQHAMSLKPEGDYNLKTIERKHFFDIDYDMIETAFAYLVKKNIDLYKESRANYMNGDVSDLYEIYGAEILESISIGEIFDMCKMTIVKYQSFTEDDNMWLMHLFSSFNKNEDIFNRLLAENFKPYFMSLYEYVGDG